ncbi:MAG: sensor histidine kinase [Acidimicrobiales bacterium]
MAGLVELARSLTGLGGAPLAHLQRLVVSWGPLADLCFADLLLLVPLAHDPGDQFVVIGQVRPSTSQTLYHRDLVGELVAERERPPVARAFRSGQIVEAEVTAPPLHERVRVVAIPVRWADEVIAVCSRESAPSIGRRPGELERTYVAVFERFARMIAAGAFPFGAEDVETEEAPRVGDGAVVLDAAGRVTYASPNAVSALRRVGVQANVWGRRLDEVGLGEVVVATAFAIGAPVTEEIERGREATVIMRCLPLLEAGQVTGALVLVRDVSELRRRDRLLVSMDTTIREIHHRVKNNLQTVSSLLRLQGRRVAVPEARDAIEESVRRIHSIALVHETLSREAGDDVSFNEIVRPLVRMVEELVGPDRRVRIAVTGSAGRLPVDVATPLAVVLTELLQNAVDHAYPLPRARPGCGQAPAAGRVVLALDNDGERLVVTVVDDGVGLPPGFDAVRTEGLGLSIVRSLVTSQLEGTLSVGRREDDPRGGAEGSGTVVTVQVPLDRAARGRAAPVTGR